eukprot:scaffold249320_cov24-Tisochrysis_lutea.AAC.1
MAALQERCSAIEQQANSLKEALRDMAQEREVCGARGSESDLGCVWFCVCLPEALFDSCHYDKGCFLDCLV